MNINNFNPNLKFYRFEMMATLSIMKITQFKISKIQIQTESIGLESLKKMIDEGSLLVKIGKEYASNFSEPQKSVTVLKSKTDKEGNVTEKTVNIDLRNLTEAEKAEVIAYIESTINESREEIKKTKSQTPKKAAAKRHKANHQADVSQESSVNTSNAKSRFDGKSQKQENAKLEKEIAEERINEHRQKEKAQEQLVRSNFETDTRHKIENQKFESNKSN